MINKIKFLYEYIFVGRTIRNLLLKCEKEVAFDTPKPNLIENPSEYSKKDFEHYIEQGEWGLASDVLMHIMEENQDIQAPSVGFWPPFYRSQTMMKRKSGLEFCMRMKTYLHQENQNT